MRIKFMDNLGCILLARKTMENELWNKPAEWLKIWLYILIKVNYKDTKTLKRGQGFFNFSNAAELLRGGITINSIEHCIKWLKSAEQIATQKAARGVVITVLNYALYQNIEHYKSGTESGTKSDTPAEQRRNSGGTILKERKKERIYINTGNASPENKKFLKPSIPSRHLGFQSIGQMVTGDTRVTTQAQSEALRIAEKLGISLDKASQSDPTLRGRWFRLFKDAYIRRQAGTIQGVYSYFSDHTKFHSVRDNEKIKLFFWKFNNPYVHLET